MSTYRVDVNRVVVFWYSLKFFLWHRLSLPHQIHIVLPRKQPIRKQINTLEHSSTNQTAQPIKQLNQSNTAQPMRIQLDQSDNSSTNQNTAQPIKSRYVLLYCVIVSGKHCIYFIIVLSIGHQVMCSGLWIV